MVGKHGEMGAVPDSSTKARVGRGTVLMPPWPELDLAPWEGG